MRNRIKGLDLIDRVPDELWTEDHDVLQETGIKTITKKKKFQKGKWLSEKALQRAVKRREAKSKGEKQRYTDLNAEFPRIARRDKKAFLNNQCKEKEENYYGKAEKAMAPHSSTLAWKIPWAEELSRIQSMGLQELDIT